MNELNIRFSGDSWKRKRGLYHFFTFQKNKIISLQRSNYIIDSDRYFLNIRHKILFCIQPWISFDLRINEYHSLNNRKKDLKKIKISDFSYSEKLKHYFRGLKFFKRFMLQWKNTLHWQWCINRFVLTINTY